MALSARRTRDAALYRVLGLFWLGLIVAPFCSPTANAKPAWVETLTPTAAFVQAGVADQDTHAYVIGAIWDWSWQKQYPLGTLTGYFDASVGRWITSVDDTRSSAWMTQLGVTPVLRLQPAKLRHWFVEVGVGANVILPIYRSRDKRFSTEFNFGDHVAVGRWLDDKHRHELALRLQHFSNAGIDQPNPGENFIQIRYARHF